MGPRKSPLPPRSGEGEGRGRAARPRSGASLRSIAVRRPVPATGVQDRQAHAVTVDQDVGVPKFYHAPSSRLEKGGAPGVVVQLVGMLAAIDLDDETGVSAGKVEEKRAEGELTLPLPAAESMRSQCTPEVRLRARVRAPQRSRTRDRRRSSKRADLAHGWDVNICGTPARAQTRAPPSPYPLPLSLRSGERG